MLAFRGVGETIELVNADELDDVEPLRLLRLRSC